MPAASTLWVSHFSSLFASSFNLIALAIPQKLKPGILADDLINSVYVCLFFN